MKIEIRNDMGTLLFEVMFQNGKWYVMTRNHGRYTLVILKADGSFEKMDHVQEGK